jgi:hypothetical protein
MFDPFKSSTINAFESSHLLLCYRIASNSCCAGKGMPRLLMACQSTGTVPNWGTHSHVSLQHHWHQPHRSQPSNNVLVVVLHPPTRTVITPHMTNTLKAVSSLLVCERFLMLFICLKYEIYWRFIAYSPRLTAPNIRG